MTNSEGVIRHLYICEQCGVKMRDKSKLHVHWAGYRWYFCGYTCRDYWLGERQSRFSKPPKVTQ